MQNNLYQKLRFRFYLLFALVIFLFLSIFTSVYYFAFKKTDENYSFIQKYEKYYSVEDWNLTKHAVVDIDNDGKKDMITFTNCAFLSSVVKEKISKDKQCTEEGMSFIAFPDKSITVGQKLSSKDPFTYPWLKKSYLVKTQNNVWKYYDMVGLQLRTYELGEDLLFKEMKPTFLDKVDNITYQATNLGVALFLIITNI